MPTECISDQFDFARAEGRSVVAAFDGGRVTSDAGALLLGATDRAISLVERFAACFADRVHCRLNLVDTPCTEHDPRTCVCEHFGEVMAEAG